MNRIIASKTRFINLKLAKIHVKFLAPLPGNCVSNFTYLLFLVLICLFSCFLLFIFICQFSRGFSCFLVFQKRIEILKMYDSRSSDERDTLDEGSMTIGEGLRTGLVVRTFPSFLARDLVQRIRRFEQGENETIPEAWIRMKMMLAECYGNNISKEEVVTTFYYGLNKKSQHPLDLTSKGLFTYNSPNQAYKLLQDITIAGKGATHFGEDKRIQERSVKVEIKERELELVKPP